MNDRRVAVRAVIIDEGKLFCVRQRRFNGEVSDFWCTPGGGVDPKEPLLAALHREMIEETGVTPEIGQLLFVQQFVFGEREFLEFFFHVTNAQDFHELDLSKTTHGVQEIADYGFIEPANNILPVFLQTDLPTDPTTASTRFYDYELNK